MNRTTFLVTAALLAFASAPSRAQTTVPQGLIGGPSFSRPGHADSTGSPVARFGTTSGAMEQSHRALGREVNAWRIACLASLRQRLEPTQVQVERWHDVSAAISEAMFVMADCRIALLTTVDGSVASALAHADERPERQRRNLQHILALLLTFHEALSQEQRDNIDEDLSSSVF